MCFDLSEWLIARNAQSSSPWSPEAFEFLISLVTVSLQPCIVCCFRFCQFRHSGLRVY